MQDIGFGGVGPETAFDTAVINRYFDWYLPLAVQLGDAMASGAMGPDRHIYTAHAFIVSLYLDCPPGMGLHCPTEVALAAFRASVAAGWITWTALPANLQVRASAQAPDELTWCPGPV